MPISMATLKSYVAGYPANPSRTRLLEQQLEIGTGFHGKWYRSQQDHWLGWLVVQECKARSAGNDPEALWARGIWQRLNCSPMMLWLAEAGGVASHTLDSASEAAMEARKINRKDGAPHGTMMREHLPWEHVETAILNGPQALESIHAETLALDAFTRLLAKNSSYRHLVEWLPAHATGDGR